MKRYIKYFKEQNQLEKSFLCNYKGFDVYTVNGDYVKISYSMEFVEGGNFKVYDFVPENEIWIDNKIDKEDRIPILIHEYVEVIHMLKGMDYDSAHNKANQEEKKYREKINELS